MSAKPSAPNRPLSPFMLGSYYRLQISSVLSFTHRLTGLALSVGTIFIAVWLLSTASGPASYGGFIYFAHSVVGQLLLLGWSWALLYHLCNGIRHLVWDTGHAFERRYVDLGGWLVIIASLVLTAAVWALAYLV